MTVDRRALRRFPGRKRVGRDRRPEKDKRAAQLFELCAQMSEGKVADKNLVKERNCLDEGAIVLLAWQEGALVATDLSGQEAFSICGVPMPITCSLLKQAIGEHIREDALNMSLLRDHLVLESYEAIQMDDDIVLKKDRETIKFYSRNNINLSYMGDSGMITAVRAGQAADAGIKAGWRIMAIDGKPYTEELAEEVFEALEESNERDHSFKFWIPVIRKSRTITFRSWRAISMTYYNSNGAIIAVQDGQPVDAGVKVGWRIMAIDGMPYTVELAQQVFAALHEEGEVDHVFTFEFPFVHEPICTVSQARRQCNGEYVVVDYFNGRPKYEQLCGQAIIYFRDYWKINDKSDVETWLYQNPSSEEAHTPPEGQWPTDASSKGAKLAPMLSFSSRD